MTSYQAFYARSLADPEGFWAEQARMIDWHKPFAKVLDAPKLPFRQWFVGGETNLAHNCLDRHLATRGDQVALVWISSEVAAERRPGTDDADLLRASFPPGSVTGAPKIAAVGVIDELESSAREVFTGAIGFASPAAGLELSVVIRTFEIAGEHIWLDVGGGIVADSDPVAEAEEAYDKARPLLEAIAAPEATAPRTGPAPQPRRLSPLPAPRPDERGGLLETIGVVDGVPVALDRHLDRLRASMRALYGRDLPPLDIAAALPGAGAWTAP